MENHHLGNALHMLLTFSAATFDYYFEQSTLDELALELNANLLSQRQGSGSARALGGVSMSRSDLLLAMLKVFSLFPLLLAFRFAENFVFNMICAIILIANTYHIEPSTISLFIARLQKSARNYRY